MKNETARREIESLDYYLQNHTDDYSEESHTAMMMAKDALNNADMLEQIRAEIEQYEAECALIIPINDRTCKRCTFDTFKDIYQIIDRYTK